VNSVDLQELLGDCLELSGIILAGLDPTAIVLTELARAIVLAISFVTFCIWKDILTKSCLMRVQLCYFGSCD